MSDNNNIEFTEHLHFYLMQQYEHTRKRESENSRKTLNRTRAQSIDVPLPPPKEQEVKVVLLLKKYIEIERLENVTTAQMLMVDKNKQSLLISAFTRELH